MYSINKFTVHPLCRGVGFWCLEQSQTKLSSPAQASDMGWCHLRVPGGTRMLCLWVKPSCPCQKEAKHNCSKAAVPSQQTSVLGRERPMEGANHPQWIVITSRKHCHGLVLLQPGPEAEAMARGRWHVCLGHGGTGRKGKGPGQYWAEMCTKERHGSKEQACFRLANGVWGCSRRRKPQSQL